MSATAQVLNEQSVGFKHILIATDFSEISQRALDYAIAVARRYRSELYLVHAIPARGRPPIPLDPLPRELDRERLEAEQQMKWLSDKAASSEITQHALVERGHVSEVLSAVIDRESIDLVVLGTHGRGGLEKLVLGSVAEEVLRLVSCPVLTIGQRVSLSSETPDFQTILFATDFGPAADKALPYAVTLAEDYRARLVLLHMVPPIPFLVVGPAAYGPPAYTADELMTWQVTERQESGEKLRKLLPPSAKLVHEPEYVVGTDFLPEGILDMAVAHNADLIVMGANRAPLSRAVAHLPWALTLDVICQAKCPVLTVRD
jgi:nucleotide-binding universal stress UspA family protein